MMQGYYVIIIINDLFLDNISVHANGDSRYRVRTLTAQSLLPFIVINLDAHVITITTLLCSIFVGII